MASPVSGWSVPSWRVSGWARLRELRWRTRSSVGEESVGGTRGVRGGEKAILVQRTRREGGLNEDLWKKDVNAVGVEVIVVDFKVVVGEAG